MSHKLFYESLTLVGYKRLMLNDIREFTITPHEMIQIILGTNGSGKSSILSEMSPMPGDKNDFLKGGSKRFVAILDNVKYILTNYFHPNKHSFVKVVGDEHVELNPGGTLPVQMEKIREIFHMDKQIHDLMRDADKFTEMGPTARREWITRLSVADYDFAMKAYDKIRTRHRETAGALKRNNAHLVVETAKIISQDEEVRLQKEVSELQEELNILNAERMPLEAPVQSFEDRKTRVLRELEDISMRLLRNKIIAPLLFADGEILRDEWGEPRRTSFKSIEEVDGGISELKNRLVASEAVVHQCTEQFNKLNNNYEVLLKAGQDGVQNLAKQFQALEVERLSLLERRKLRIDIENPTAALKAFESILPNLQELLENIPANADRRYGRERMRVLQESTVELETKRANAKDEMTKLQAQVEHADHHRRSGKMTCPECGHGWVAGIREDEYARAKEIIARLGKVEDDLTKQLEKNREETREMESYFNQYREFMGFVRNVAILEPFWLHLMESKFVTDVPKEAFNQVRIFQRDLEYEVQAHEILLKMDEISKLRAAAEQVGDVKLQDIKDEMDVLSSKLGFLTGQIARLRQSISEYSEYRRHLIAGQQMADRVKELHDHAHTLQDGYVEALRRESIIHCIGQIQQALVLKHESLRLATTQKAIVAKLQEHVDELIVEEEALASMERELSPVNGLIAEGLLGFIKVFVAKMNSFIKKIWTYPLKIIPTGFNADNADHLTELDYKFKMVVGDYNNIVPDVSKGSDGIREIVNLSFKITAINYLHLAHAPLLLDEFGRTFDDAHRSAATHAIKSLMDNYNHTQLFMVSHHQIAYGSFETAEICVLDRRNLALMDGVVYNKHVEMK